MRKVTIATQQFETNKAASKDDIEAELIKVDQERLTGSYMPYIHKRRIAGVGKLLCNHYRKRR